MAVILYKDGKPEIFNEHSYLHMLDAGYSYFKDGDPEETELEEPIILVDEIPEDEPERQMTDDEIRAKAKEMGIKSWHNKSIDKLIKEIAPEE